jgi:CubicO group peptidase (beta-lactamase class C family)
MKRKLILILLVLPFIVFAQKPYALKNQITQTLQAEKLAGAVWSIVDLSGQIVTDATGLKNVPLGESMKPTDRVHVGSITKTVLAMGILRLMTEGKLAMDAPVNTYLPNVQFDNPWSNTDPVTVRHLLDNTSGLGDLRLWHFFSTTAVPDTPLETFYASDPTTLKIYARPGTVFSYSNMGYTLLGMLMEAVTRQRYEDYLDKHLLQPLGMRQSTFHFVSQAGTHTDSRLAMGHFENGQTAEALPIYLRPAGQFTTTAYDMALLLKFLMGDGTVNGQTFIDRKYLSNLGRPQGTNAVKNGLPHGYTCGTILRDRHGVLGVYNLGNIIGYRATIYVFPEAQKAFFISYNMDSETTNYELFNELFINYLGIPKRKFTAALSPVTEVNEWQGYYVPVVTKYEPFALVDILTGFTQLTIENDKVFLKPFQQPTRELRYIGQNRFSMEGRTEASHVLYQADKNMFWTDGLRTGQKINGWIIAGLWVSVGLGMLGQCCVFLSGIYQWIRLKASFVRKLIFAAFCAIVFLFVPVPFFLSQPFIAIGNQNLASMLLMAATVVLPVGVLASLVRYFRQKPGSLLQKIDLVTLLLALQGIGLLAFWGMIPFRLWT